MQQYVHLSPTFTQDSCPGGSSPSLDSNPCPSGGMSGNIPDNIVQLSYPSPLQRQHETTALPCGYNYAPDGDLSSSYVFHLGLPQTHGSHSDNAKAISTAFLIIHSHGNPSALALINPRRVACVAFSRFHCSHPRGVTSSRYPNPHVDPVVPFNGSVTIVSGRSDGYLMSGVVLGL